MATSNNVNTTSKVIKSNSEVTPYELGTFISNDQNQNDQMKNVAVLNDKTINGNVDPVLQEIKNLQQTMLQIGQRVESIENDGIKGRDLDKQLIEALKDLKNYSTFFEQATFQMETKLVKTSFSIAKKIIGIELGENSQNIAKETISGMMDKIKTSSKVTIHLNPKDYMALKDQLKFDSFVSLQEDINVTAGGVVIASDLGNFDGNIESKLETMLGSLDALV
ncbi:MAG: FliH/SctL family protein [Arcobacteraceae bacterium]